jgi:hypothetical protein
MRRVRRDTWRAQRLRLGGFDPDTAATLAEDQRIDLHALLELVERGCPPRLAARILAPLEPPRAGRLESGAVERPPG